MLSADHLGYEHTREGEIGHVNLVIEAVTADVTGWMKEMTDTVNKPLSETNHRTPSRSLFPSILKGICGGRQNKTLLIGSCTLGGRTNGGD